MVREYLLAASVIREAKVVSSKDIQVGIRHCQGARTSKLVVFGCSYWAQKEVLYANGVRKYYCGSHFDGVEPNPD